MGGKKSVDNTSKEKNEKRILRCLPTDSMALCLQLLLREKFTTEEEKNEFKIFLFIKINREDIV